MAPPGAIRTCSKRRGQPAAAGLFLFASRARRATRLQDHAFADAPVADHHAVQAEHLGQRREDDRARRQQVRAARVDADHVDALGVRRAAQLLRQLLELVGRDEQAADRAVLLFEQQPAERARGAAGGDAARGLRATRMWSTCGASSRLDPLAQLARFGAGHGIGRLELSVQARDAEPQRLLEAQVRRRCRPRARGCRRPGRARAPARRPDPRGGGTRRRSAAPLPGRTGCARRSRARGRAARPACARCARRAARRSRSRAAPPRPRARAARPSRLAASTARSHVSGGIKPSAPIAAPEPQHLALARDALQVSVRRRVGDHHVERGAAEVGDGDAHLLALGARAERVPRRRDVRDAQRLAVVPLEDPGRRPSARRRRPRARARRARACRPGPGSGRRASTARPADCRAIRSARARRSSTSPRRAAARSRRPVRSARRAARRSGGSAAPGSRSRARAGTPSSRSTRPIASPCPAGESGRSTSSCHQPARLSALACRIR